MTVKGYLKRASVINARIRQDEIEITKLEQMAAGVKGICYDKDKVQTSPEDRLAEIMAEIDERKRRLIVRIREYMRARDEIYETIQQVEDPRYIQLLYLHYLDEKRLEEVACIMTKRNGAPYSYQHIREMHGHALQQLERIIC